MLVATDVKDPFSDQLCASIFKTEGLFECDSTDWQNLGTRVSLARYRELILTDGVGVTRRQVQLITEWAKAGGAVIAMRPQDNLAPLLGIGPVWRSLDGGYIKVNSTLMPGIETAAMQIHGDVDLRPLAGARAVAWYASAQGPSRYPAVTEHAVGRGRAVSFAFDVAKSVVLTRQGDPTLAGALTTSPLHRPFSRTDLLPRFTDMFGRGWLDVSRVSIPQADMLQRMLDNLIEDAAPVPRFWYFPAHPGGLMKAVIVMTGDDHDQGNSQTLQRFAAELQASPAACRGPHAAEAVADWLCYTSTSYAFPGAFPGSSKNDTVASYLRAGFEVSPHISEPGGACSSHWSDAAELRRIMTQSVHDWASATGHPRGYPWIAINFHPQTLRDHCYGIWHTYADIPKEEERIGIRADTNPPCWPQQFLPAGQCLFTGTGLPQEYSDQEGHLTGVYEMTTVATDENPATVTYTALDGLIRNATGPKAYYGEYVVLCHLDNHPESRICEDNVMKVVRRHHVPLISARQAVDFWRARSQAQITGLTYHGGIVSWETISHAHGLQLMEPLRYGTRMLSGLSVNGRPVRYPVETINGMSYALATVPEGTATMAATYR
jgi:hypothetical protein